MARHSTARIVRNLRYADKILADPTISPERRAAIEATAAHLRGQLAGHCDTCGKSLTTAESLARGRGPECERKAVAA